MKDTSAVLVVETQPGTGASQALAGDGGQLVTARVWEEARRWLESDSFDFALLDLALAGDAGLEATVEAGRGDILPEVGVLTDRPSLSEAAAAVEKPPVARLPGIDVKTLGNRVEACGISL